MSMAAIWSDARMTGDDELHTKTRAPRTRQLVLLVEAVAGVGQLLRSTFARVGLDADIMAELPRPPHNAQELAAEAIAINTESLADTPQWLEEPDSSSSLTVIGYRVRGQTAAPLFETGPVWSQHRAVRAMSFCRRVRALLKPRPVLIGALEVEAGPIRVHTSTFRVSVNNAPVAMTAIEFRLLAVILAAKGHVVSRERLLEQVWGIRRHVDTRTVDTHVRRLRQKLREGAFVVATARGFGYHASTPVLFT